jgi:16S rRNA (guanine527-N7)-methyltransferase
MTVEEAASACGLTLDPDRVERLEQYLDLVLAWNRRVDLVAPGSREEIRKRHLFDSLLLLVMADPPPEREVVDIGSGAGFPGLVWAIARPDLRVALVEPRHRRAAFLERVLLEMHLPNANVFARRAEDLAREPEHRGRYDLATARSLGPAEEIRQLARPLLRPGGAVFVPIGPDAPVPEGARLLTRPVPWAPRRVRRAVVFLEK